MEVTEKNSTCFFSEDQKWKITTRRQWWFLRPHWEHVTMNFSCSFMCTKLYSYCFININICWKKVLLCLFRCTFVCFGVFERMTLYSSTFHWPIWPCASPLNYLNFIRLGGGIKGDHQIPGTTLSWTAVVFIGLTTEMFSKQLPSIHPSSSLKRQLEICSSI